MASAARRTRTTKAAQCTGVDQAASNTKGDDIASREKDSNVDASNNTDDNTKRAGQPKKVREYGRRGIHVATAPYNSDDEPDSSVDETRTPRATDKADEATRDGGCGERLQERREAGEGLIAP